MPELKSSDIAKQVEKINLAEGIDKNLENKELQEIAQDSSEKTLVDEAQNNEKISKTITQRIDSLTKAEEVRESLGITDLNTEKTNQIAQQKKELQEVLTGMNPKDLEEDHSQLDIEKNALAEPSTQLEKKEAVTFNMKEVYTAVTYMLDVFQQRAEKVGGFDIISQKVFNNFAELHKFMTEKVLGEHPEDETSKVDFSMQSEMNNEMLEKFQGAIDSLEFIPPTEWQSPFNSGGEQVQNLQEITEVMDNFHNQLIPFSKALENSGAYAQSGRSLGSLTGKVKNLTDYMGAKTESYREHLR